MLAKERERKNLKEMKQVGDPIESKWEMFYLSVKIHAEFEDIGIIPQKTPSI